MTDTRQGIAPADGPGPDPVVRIEGLRIERHDPQAESTFVLDVPAFTASAGDRVGFVGESGSGKTTFLEMLGLLTWPDEIARFDLKLGTGQDEARRDVTGMLRRRQTDRLAELRARHIGFIIQDGGLLPYMTVLENARLAAELSLGAAHTCVDDIRAAARAIGIGDFLNRLPASLSGGQRQRAAVLRAVVTQPNLIIGDEPTASLDPGTSDDVMRLLVDQAAARGSTIVLASHNAPLLKRFGFRLARVSIAEQPGLCHATLGIEAAP